MFEPISGTIGAIAFADQLFSRVMWTYGKYKISKAFGRDFVEFSIRYESEVWRFESIRDHTMFNLTEDPVDDKGTELRPALRNRFYQWALALQQCEALIKECEGINENEGTEEAELSDGMENSRLLRTALSPTAITLTSSLSPSATHISSTPTSVSTRATTGRSTPTPVRDVEDNTSNEHVTPKQKKHSKFRPRSWFQSSKRPQRDEGNRHGENDRVPASLVGNPERDIHHSTSPVVGSGPSHLRDMSNRLQEESSVGQRVSWILKRVDFVNLLDQLTDHGNFFSSAIQIDEMKQASARLLKAERLKPLLGKYKDAGRRLRQLAESLKHLNGVEQMKFQLMLHSEPFQLQTQLKKCTGHDRFRPDSAAFYARLCGQLCGTVSGKQPQSDPQNRYIIFDVPSNSPSSAAAGHRIDDVQLLVSHTPAAVDVQCSAAFLGHIDAEIHVFQDSTAHSTEKSLAKCLADLTERRFLGQNSHADFRVRLGLVVASSLFYLVLAQGPRNLEAKDLSYYPALEEDGSEFERRKTRINPFARLTVARTTSSSSIAAALAGADGGDAVETVMVRKLGILLYEIGTWTLVSGVGSAEAIRSVMVRKERLSIISPIYRDVIGACLTYRVEGRVDDWMLEHVVTPLKRAVDNFDKIELLR